MDHNINRWYQFVYGIIYIMLGIIWKPIYFYLIGILFVMIVCQERVQRDYIRRNVKN